MSTVRKRTRAIRRKDDDTTTLRLKPADPFELIRWLARSQSDPRKAVAELVQNSLDAGAHTVRIERRRQRKVTALIVRDDGEGVIPEMAREEALRYLASNVGHELELRTRVAGSGLLALHLVEDQPRATIVPLPMRLDAPPTYTEIVVSHLHEAAQRLLSGKRLADYLAAELRGQLLRRDVTLTIEDKIGRGPGQRHFHVVPERFKGERLVLPERVSVPGYLDARVELYLARGDTSAAVQLACAGTLVADDIAELSTLGFDEAPWVGCSVTGLIDFPGFQVPPGTRRGVMPDAAAAAFVQAMERLRPQLSAELERLEQERAEAASRDVAKELRRALRGFRQRLPQYELPTVEARHGGPGPAIEPLAEGASWPDDAETGSPTTPAPIADLFPAGPLSSLTRHPDVIKVPAGGQRRVQVRAVDAEGRRIDGEPNLSWQLEGAGFTLVGSGLRPAVRADASIPVGTMGRLLVEATSDGRAVSAEAAVVVIEPSLAESGTAGIPEPELVSDPAGPWRGRMRDGRWQVNDAHEDYIALRSDARARLRYLIALLAKELVQRTYGMPADEQLLERFVEILAHAERNLRRGAE